MQEKYATIAPNPVRGTLLTKEMKVNLPAKVCGLLVILCTAEDDNLAKAALVGANKVTPSPRSRKKKKKKKTIDNI